VSDTLPPVGDMDINFDEINKSPKDPRKAKQAHSPELALKRAPKVDSVKESKRVKITRNHLLLDLIRTDNNEWTQSKGEEDLIEYGEKKEELEDKVMETLVTTENLRKSKKDKNTNPNLSF